MKRGSTGLFPLFPLTGVTLALFVFGCGKNQNDYEKSAISGLLLPALVELERVGNQMEKEIDELRPIRSAIEGESKDIMKTWQEENRCTLDLLACKHGMLRQLKSRMSGLTNFLDRKKSIFLAETASGMDSLTVLELVRQNKRSKAKEELHKIRGLSLKIREYFGLPLQQQ